MARRMIAGILGAVVGVLPLALVNLLVNGAGTFGEIEAQAAANAVVLGAVALVGGVVLGAVTTGWMAGRSGGVAGATVAGVIAAVLYAVVVIFLVVGGARQGWGPPVAAIHPLRASAAILLVASLLLGITLIVGRLAEDTRPSRPAMPAASSRPMGRPVPGAPQRPGVSQPRDPRQYNWDDGSWPARPPVGGRHQMGTHRSAPRYPR